MSEEQMIESADASFVNELEIRLHKALTDASTGAETKRILGEAISRQEEEVREQYPNELHPGRIARLEALVAMRKLIS